jgi:hypothetical protein
MEKYQSIRYLSTEAAFFGDEIIGVLGSLAEARPFRLGASVRSCDGSVKQILRLRRRMTILKFGEG